MAVRKGTTYSSLFHSVVRHMPKLLLGTFVIVLVFAGNQINLKRYFPIKVVRVYGVQHLNVQHIKQTLLPMAKQGFFNVNVENVRDRLRQMPWVSGISVRRNWPDELVVTILERRAIARWNNKSLLSTEGDLFQPAFESYPAALAELTGPVGKQIIMLKYFVKMNRIMRSIHAKISVMELTPYDTWNIALDNGIALKLDYDDALTRLGQFVKVYPKIVRDRANTVDYVDLRYSNGMAVKWKKKV